MAHLARISRNTTLCLGVAKETLPASLCLWTSQDSQGRLRRREYARCILGLVPSRVALHGSWNRQQLSGYKLVRVKFNGEKPERVLDFATGWLNNSSNEAWGRPVDVIAGPDGALYVSDDGTGFIYRISYQPTH